METDEHDKEEDLGNKNQGEALWALSFRDEFHLTYLREMKVTADAVCLVLGPEAVHEYWSADGHVTSKGCVVLVPNLVEPAMFLPQPVPQMFDICTAKSWLHYCAQNHSVFCASEPSPTYGVKVIDCTTLLVEECGTHTPYVALSYVWGTAGATCAVLRDADGRKKLPSSLSPVIQDSIKVTRALEYRYLWIDKFCIDQDSSDLKHDQIRQMDVIYQNSELTLISAAGMDDQYGLPGVGARERSRPRHLMARLQDVTVMWTPSDPYDAIDQSHGSTRGWTYQEAVLSRRRLVFTDDQVYFECQAMNCFESVYHPLDELHIEDKSKTHEYLRTGFFVPNLNRYYGQVDPDSLTMNDAFCQYIFYVEEYTSRNLRFDEDSVNAFQGILRKLSRQKLPLQHIWGLCYPQESGDRHKFFAYSLNWMHMGDKKRPRPRTMFPFWTWAGWEGEVFYHLQEEDDIDTNCLQKICFRTEDDSLISLDDAAPESRYPVLHITAPTVSMSRNADQPTADTTVHTRGKIHRSV